MELIELFDPKHAPLHLQLAARAALAVKGVRVFSYTVRDATALHVQFPDNEHREWFNPEHCITHALQLLHMARRYGLIQHDGPLAIVMMINSAHVRCRIDYGSQPSQRYGSCITTDTNHGMCYAITSAIAQHHAEATQA